MRRVIACLVGVAVFAAALGGCGVGSNDSHRVEGPLVTGDGGEAFVMVAKPGEVFTDGSAVIDLGGSQPATLVKVESLGGGPALTFLGAQLAGPRRRVTTTTTFRGWPPHGLRPSLVTSAIGRTVKPAVETTRQQAYELLLGYQINEAAYAVRTGIRITYTVGGATYQATLPFGLVTCPSKHLERSCLRRASATWQ